MGVAENLVGQVLPSKQGFGNWRVVEKVEPHPESAGSSMSVGYRVRNEDGREAFLKASDIDTVTDGDDNLGRIQALASQQTFERNILDRCNGNKMDRVVTPIDFGDGFLGHQDVKELVFWIIFEPAKWDARRQMYETHRFNFHWMVTAMHNIAVGISQLHAAKVTHNDVRPSNVLCFSEVLQKLSDLGLAYCPEISALHYGKVCLGDARLAAPELLYSLPPSYSDQDTEFDFRRGTDLFLLGSLGYFFVTGSMLTPEVFSHMSAEHAPACDGLGWQGTFDGALPYFRAGYAQAMTRIQKVLPANLDGDLTATSQRYLDAITYLTEPDPRLRGHPLDRQGHHDQYSLNRFVSVFDDLRKKSLS